MSAQATPPRVAVPQIVFKLVGACNLACTYCYQTTVATVDQSGFRALRHIPEDRFRDCMNAVARYTIETGAEQFNLVFQGGEPLLVGRERFRAYASAARSIAASHRIRAHISVQTNGTLIDDSWIELFREEQIAVSVSIDGPASVHDARRVRHSGSGTFTQIEQNVRRSVAAGLSVGALVVMTPGASGAETYEVLVELGFEMVGLLFPAHNYEHPDLTYGPGFYADFLTSFFDAWFDSSSTMRVHNFDAMIRASKGAPSTLAGIGGAASDAICFAPDGSVEAGDSYGLCEYRRLTDMSADEGIRRATRSEYAQLQRVGGFRPTGEPCGSCAVAHICEGGMLEHRYSRTRGFDNPSYYCEDLAPFYTHVVARLEEAEKCHQA